MWRGWSNSGEVGGRWERKAIGVFVDFARWVRETALISCRKGRRGGKGLLLRDRTRSSPAASREKLAFPIEVVRSFG